MPVADVPLDDARPLTLAPHACRMGHDWRKVNEVHIEHGSTVPAEWPKPCSRLVREDQDFIVCIRPGCGIVSLAQRAEREHAISRLVYAARLASDFTRKPTPAFVDEYGPGVTTRDVADKLATALEDYEQAARPTLNGVPVHG